MKEIKGRLIGKGKKVAIIISRFNEFVSRRLLEGAIDCLIRHGVLANNIVVYWTPGSFEIPGVARRVRSGKFDCLLCLGAVIRGDTPHFDYIAAEVTKGIASLNLEKGAPVIYGIITADTIEQAIERAGTKAGNRGWDAAMAGLELADLYTQIK
ncbi:6,7-dimethyl-8-ribityllumazine synthase [candidate division WOR-3 bacterium 4484_100]|uniref:6,7-dimethyl-8-ribityllumazine synthase n=1 Tax=candidate division WOR-3 bacterium 4484_100 TaxID=1936077 RepID=A0A1V4QFG0_UNCW3|nr:MAG: 6,7-dimethyl-8-ribityllumazine synthase [candidate division WOR-3 bacterium 4484_100]